MFRDDEKLGTTVVAHEELSKILCEMDSIASALRSIIEAVEQTAIIGQDVQHRLDEVVSRREVTAIQCEHGSEIRTTAAEHHNRIGLRCLRMHNCSITVLDAVQWQHNTILKPISTPSIEGLVSLHPRRLPTADIGA